jgi:hypothetical protein
MNQTHEAQSRAEASKLGRMWYDVGRIICAHDERGAIIGAWVCIEAGEFGRWEWKTKP